MDPIPVSDHLPDTNLISESNPPQFIPLPESYYLSDSCPLPESDQFSEWPSAQINPLL